LFFIFDIEVIEERCGSFEDSIDVGILKEFFLPLEEVILPVDTSLTRQRRHC
jgi:hypothetical protein